MPKLDPTYIQEKLISITQDPKAIGGKQTNVLIVGDSAINKACSYDGDLAAMMEYFLSVLPRPKMFWIKVLAIWTAANKYGGGMNASRELGLGRNTFYSVHLRHSEAIKKLKSGVSFTELIETSDMDDLESQEQEE